MKTVTLDWLLKHKACELQAEIFEAEWGESAELTLENLLRAAELELDLDWLAYKILSPLKFDKYQNVIVPAWDDCLKTLTSAVEEFDLETAEFVKAIKPGKAQFLTTQALVLWNILESDYQKAMEESNGNVNSINSTRRAGV